MVNGLGQSIGFSVKGNMSWGVFEGYRFSIIKRSDIHRLQIFTSVSFPQGADTDSVAAVLKTISFKKVIRPDYSPNNAALKTMKPTKIIRSHSITERGVEVFISPHPTEKALAQALHTIAEALHQQNAIPVCHNCGSMQSLSFMQIDGMPLTLCGNCAEQAEDRNRLLEDAIAEIPGNRVRGAIGAIIGSLLGIAIWIGIGLLGYLSVFGGMAIFGFAALGYTLMKGKLDRTGVAIICVICFAAFVLAQFLTYDAYLVRDILSQGYEPDYWVILLSSFEIPFMNSEITRYFMSDLAFGLLFFLLGSWWTARKFNHKTLKTVTSDIRLQG
jgi:hypothetical protein